MQASFAGRKQIDLRRDLARDAVQTQNDYDYERQ